MEVVELYFNCNGGASDAVTLKAVAVYCSYMCLTISCSVCTSVKLPVSCEAAWPQKSSVFRGLNYAVDHAIRHKCLNTREIYRSCCSVCVLCPAPVYAAQIICACVIN